MSGLVHNADSAKVGSTHCAERICVIRIFGEIILRTGVNGRIRYVGVADGVSDGVAVVLAVNVGVAVSEPDAVVDELAVAVGVGVIVRLPDGDRPYDTDDVGVAVCDAVWLPVLDALAVDDGLGVGVFVGVLVGVLVGVGNAGASAMPWNCAAGAAANASGAPPNSHVSAPVLNAYIAFAVTVYSVTVSTASAACT